VAVVLCERLFPVGVPGVVAGEAFACGRADLPVFDVVAEDFDAEFVQFPDEEPEFLFLLLFEFALFEDEEPESVFLLCCEVHGRG